MQQVKIQGIWYDADTQVIEALNLLNAELQEVYDLIAALKLKEEAANQVRRRPFRIEAWKAKLKLYECLPEVVLKQAELWR